MLIRRRRLEIRFPLFTAAADLDSGGDVADAAAVEVEVEERRRRSPLCSVLIE